MDQLLEDLRNHTERAFAAGFVATMVATLLLYYMAPAFAGRPIDMAALLTLRLNDNPMLGAMAHYITGVILFPTGFLLFWRLMPAALALKGVIWGVSLFLIASLAMLPAVGAGFFMQAAGLSWGGVAFWFATHLVYGVLLALILGDITL